METAISIAVRLIHSRDTIHLTHLKTKSYAEHMALDEYYKNIVEVFDRLIETAQGEAKEVLDLKIPASVVPEDTVKYLSELANYIEKNYKNLKSYQISILDDGLELIYSTIYKIKILK